MLDAIREFLKALLVVTKLVVLCAADLLEPKTLVRVDGRLVAAVLEEDADRILSLLHVACFDLVAGSDSVQGPVSLVENSCLFKEFGGFGPIASELHDLTLHSVEVKQGWCVRNRLIYNSESFISLPSEQVMVCQEVKQPDPDRRVLLFLITRFEHTTPAHVVSEPKQNFLDFVSLLTV